MARLVYSSGPDGGSKRGDDRGDEVPQVLPPSAHAVRVRRERGGRKGKTVTVAAPLFVARDDAKGLLGELKRSCGTGGTLKQTSAADGRACFSLELQGDHADAVTRWMVERGYPARRAGG
jgi:translation initiation factor 1